MKKKYLYNLLLFLEKICSMNELDSLLMIRLKLILKNMFMYFYSLLPHYSRMQPESKITFFINKCGGKCSVPKLQGQSLECLKV